MILLNKFFKFRTVREHVTRGKRELVELRPYVEAAKKLEV
jgi:hypothetical protein